MLAADVATALLDLLLPPSCAACREPLASSAEEPFCPACREALLPVPPGCGRCGEPGPSPRCGPCLADPPAFEALGAGGLLGGPLADAIHALKYRERPALARPLGRWLAREAAAPLLGPGARPSGAPGVRPPPPAVVAVPLARRRRIARGYDQAALLAARVADEARLPLLRGALRRVRETPPQVGRSRAERARNVAAAFAANGAVRGRDLLLVDDVVTTGATADACARALRAAGARSVRVLALARAGA